MQPKLSEADIKRQICDFLDVKMASGSIYWDRLNSGNILVLYGDKKRRIRLCHEGTADLIVLKGYCIEPFKYHLCRVIYLEVKGPKGKQREEQVEFSLLVDAQNAEYYVVRSLEDVMEVLNAN